MNNSLDRLLDGMEQTLRAEILPKLEGEFVRGQAYGIIFMLKSLKLRVAWSPAFLAEQLDALAELSAAVAELPADAPVPRVARPYPVDAKEMEALRDEGDAAVAALIAWLGGRPNAALQTYIRRQLKHELTTSARPMFAEISLGKEL